MALQLKNFKIPTRNSFFLIFSKFGLSILDPSKTKHSTLTHSNKKYERQREIKGMKKELCLNDKLISYTKLVTNYTLTNVPLETCYTKHVS